MQTARCYPRQALSMLRNKAHNLTLALLRRIAECRFAAHLPAARFQSQCKVQHAQLLLGECRGRVVLASRNVTGCSHGICGRSTISNIPCPENPVVIGADALNLT